MQYESMLNIQSKVYMCVLSNVSTFVLYVLGCRCGPQVDFCPAYFNIQFL